MIIKDSKTILKWRSLSLALGLAVSVGSLDLAYSQSRGGGRGGEGRSGQHNDTHDPVARLKERYTSAEQQKNRAQRTWQQHNLDVKNAEKAAARTRQASAKATNQIDQKTTTKQQLTTQYDQANDDGLRQELATKIAAITTELQNLEQDKTALSQTLAQQEQRLSQLQQAARQAQQDYLAKKATSDELYQQWQTAQRIQDERIADAKKQARSEGEERGRREGQERGERDGQAAGQSTGYQDGTTAGQATGSTEGYQDGLQEGQPIGEQEGYDPGFADGITSGEQKGRANGHANGSLEGYNRGFKQGHDRGYAEGYPQGNNATARQEGIVAGRQAGVDRAHATAKAEDFPRGYNLKVGQIKASKPNKNLVVDMATNPQSPGFSGHTAFASPSPSTLTFSRRHGAENQDCRAKPDFRYEPTPPRGSQPVRQAYFDEYADRYAAAMKSQYQRSCLQAYDEGYDSGYDNGYASSYDHAYRQAHSRGYTEGRDIGYDIGYQKGHSDGYYEGFGRVYEDAYAASLDLRYDEGVTSGYNQGRADGRTAGHDAAFDDGFASVTEDAYQRQLPAAREQAYNQGIAEATHDFRESDRSELIRMTLRDLNGDSRVSPGEALHLDITLRNFGKQAVKPKQLLVRIASQNNNLSLATTTRLLTGLPADSEQRYKNVFTLLPQQKVPGGVAITVTIFQNARLVATSSLTMPFGAANPGNPVPVPPPAPNPPPQPKPKPRPEPTPDPQDPQVTTLAMSAANATNPQLLAPEGEHSLRAICSGNHYAEIHFDLAEDVVPETNRYAIGVRFRGRGSLRVTASRGFGEFIDLTPLGPATTPQTATLGALEIQPARPQLKLLVFCNDHQDFILDAVTLRTLP